MFLQEIVIENFRRIERACIRIDESETLIVGRNNSGKTSLLDMVEMTLTNKKLQYSDYPLCKRKEMYELFRSFLEDEIDYDELCERLPYSMIEYRVCYEEEKDDESLGFLSPFIIDVDIEMTSAIIRAVYRLEAPESELRSILGDGLMDSGEKVDPEELRYRCKDKFSSLFHLKVYAINPLHEEDHQERDQCALARLFPLNLIAAERNLGEDDSRRSSSLDKLINTFFEEKEEEFKGEARNNVIKLRQLIADANRTIQQDSDALLSQLVNDTVGFGYPDPEADELSLAVLTKLSIDDILKSNTELAYLDASLDEVLPNTRNGLGYKNLIKIEFELAAFARDIAKMSNSCIPLLLLEEPESHMHPQLQQRFAEYLNAFLDTRSDIKIQTILTSHSSHIASTVDFSKIRYAQKSAGSLVYKDLNEFADSAGENIDFISKYLKLVQCDLFYADKVIMIEGSAEGLLISDMIAKCERDGLFDGRKYKLPNQYYAILEIGGAYAHRFIPLIEFLGIPCLIITDLDSVDENGQAASVEKGVSTSNGTIIWWARKASVVKDDRGAISLQEIRSATQADKTVKNWHIEFQVEEHGLCGRSFEDSIINANRAIYKLDKQCSEGDIKYEGKRKTDFALKLLLENPNYRVPKYIADGLQWLNEQSSSM